jgi:hypothetical protein
MLIALLPDQLSQTQTLVLIFLVLLIDVLIVALGIAGAFLFAAFKVGKGVLQIVDKAVDWAVYTVLRLVEDTLESPPFDRLPIMQMALVGVKKAYDVYSAAQGLVVAAINVVVTLVAIALFFLAAASLAILNLAALATVIHYVV